MVSYKYLVMNNTIYLTSAFILCYFIVLLTLTKDDLVAKYIISKYTGIYICSVNALCGCSGINI